ncbi:MAG TPA: hypothetical protein VNI01_12350, partial [Elusimicrobiota bacterium]|nr:hypothetical protein [Elusimicrobiota bacterium]
MRYWLHRDGALQGPLEPSDIAAFPEVDEHTLLCPEAKPPRDRKNWRFLRAFPDAAAAVAARTDARVARREQASARAAAQAPPDPKPPRARWPIAAALAAGLAATAAFLGRPAPSPQAPSRPKAAELEPWERAARQRVPGCGRSLMDVAGGPPSVSAQGGTRVR